MVSRSIPSSKLSAATPMPNEEPFASAKLRASTSPATSAPAVASGMNRAMRAGSRRTATRRTIPTASSAISIA